MNILYIIGNGFDLNLGFKTGYQDFYNYYMTQESPSKAVAELKSFLKAERYGIWADMELGMGQYTSHVGSVEELEEICHDLSRSLRQYLSEVQSGYSFQPSDTRRLYEYLGVPHSGLLEGNARAVGEFLNDGKPRVINVISFNYTNIFDRLAAFKGQAVNMDGYGKIQSIRHIHLSLNNTDVIMGVNDESQIANKSLVIPEVMDLLVKPHINIQLGTMVDNECRNLIFTANLICLFGVSLGDTDKCWWQEIGKYMKSSSKRLIYYAYDKENPQFNNQLIGKRRFYLNKLLRQCELLEDDKELLTRVFVGYRTPFFKIR